MIRRTHYVNARRTLYRLLQLGVVPVVNENDTVATDEIRFGDNDRLAALVAHLVHADALVLLTDVDALYDRAPSKDGRAADRAGERAAGPRPGSQLGSTGSRIGTGGMVTKVEAASIATTAGIATLLTSAEQVADALAGARRRHLVRADRLATGQPAALAGARHPGQGTAVAGRRSGCCRGRTADVPAAGRIGRCRRRLFRRRSGRPV